MGLLAVFFFFFQVLWTGWWGWWLLVGGRRWPAAAAAAAATLPCVIDRGESGLTLCVVLRSRPLLYWNSNSTAHRSPVLDNVSWTLASTTHAVPYRSLTPSLPPPRPPPVFCPDPTSTIFPVFFKQKKGSGWTEYRYRWPSTRARAPHPSRRYLPPRPRSSPLRRRALHRRPLFLPLCLPLPPTSVASFHAMVGRRLLLACATG